MRPVLRCTSIELSALRKPVCNRSIAEPGLLILVPSILLSQTNKIRTHFCLQRRSDRQGGNVHGSRPRPGGVLACLPVERRSLKTWGMRNHEVYQPLTQGLELLTMALLVSDVRTYTYSGVSMKFRLDFNAA